MPRISHLNIEQKGKTYRLMQEQIRATSALVLNKMDQVTDQGKETVQRLVERWNPYAPIMPAVRRDIKLEDLCRAIPRTGMSIRLHLIERAGMPMRIQTRTSKPTAMSMTTAMSMVMLTILMVMLTILMIM